MLCASGNERTDVHTENAGSEVHRAAFETGKGQDGFVAWRHLAIFGAHGRFVADEVRIGARETCRADCFVSVDHNLLFSGFFDCVEVVVVGPLAVMSLAFGKDVSDIAALDSVVAVFVHQVVGLIHVTLVVGDRA